MCANFHTNTELYRYHSGLMRVKIVLKLTFRQKLSFTYSIQIMVGQFHRLKFWTYSDIWSAQISVTKIWVQLPSALWSKVSLRLGEFADFPAHGLIEIFSLSRWEGCIWRKYGVDFRILQRGNESVCGRIKNGSSLSINCNKFNRQHFHSFYFESGQISWRA